MDIESLCIGPVQREVCPASPAAVIDGNHPLGLLKHIHIPIQEAGFFVLLAGNMYLAAIRQQLLEYRI